MLGYLPLHTFFNSSLPTTDGTVDAPPELEEPVAASVARDSYGVPHIAAGSERDLWFLNGAVHGQDRLWQLHSARMLASGRLCEFAGAKALDLDRLARQLGFRRVAQGDLEALQARAGEDGEARACLSMLEAYADGVNWVIKGLYRMPAEFCLTGQRSIAPWEVVDSLAVMRLYGFVMCFGFQHTLLRHALIELFGKERALAWTGTTESEASIPHTVSKEAAEAFRQANLSGALNRGTAALPKGQGSNWWILHGRHTVSGKPMLVGDPHLTIKIPMFWYEVHLNFSSSDPGKSISAYGVCPPGIPGILLGQNGFLATSITLSYCDVEDLYMERFRASDGKYLHKGVWRECEEQVEEAIIVKGGSTERCLYRRTCHGVILEGTTLMQFNPFQRNVVEKQAATTVDHAPQPIDTDQSVLLAYAGVPLRPQSAGIVGVRRVLFARSFKEFDEALEPVSKIIALNFAYADIEGHIGYILTGEVPRRRGQRGSELLPLVGWTGENDWDGFVTHAELPKAFDPPEGILISANHKIVDYNTYPHYLGETWKSGYRAQAIQMELNELLKDGAKVSHEDMPKVLMNVKSWAAVEFVRLLQPVEPEEDTKAALAMLKSWGGELSVDSVPASLYQLTHSEFVRLLLKTGCETLPGGARLGEAPWDELDLERLCLTVAGEGFDPAGLTKILNEIQGHLHLNVLRILRSAGGDSDGADRRWWLDGAGGRDKAVNTAVRAASLRLQEIAGEDWPTSSKAQWGSIHTCHVQHAISKSQGCAPDSGQPFDAPSVPSPGDTNTVLQAAPKSLTDLTATASNVSLRVIFDLSNLAAQESNRIIAPLGQSGQFNSKNYSDQQELWRSGGTRPVITSHEQVQKAAVATLRFSQDESTGWTFMPCVGPRPSPSSRSRSSPASEKPALQPEGSSQASAGPAQ